MPYQALSVFMKTHLPILTSRPNDRGFYNQVVVNEAALRALLGWAEQAGQDAASLARQIHEIKTTTKQLLERVVDVRKTN